MEDVAVPLELLRRLAAGGTGGFVRPPGASGRDGLMVWHQYTRPPPVSGRGPDAGVSGGHSGHHASQTNRAGPARERGEIPFARRPTSRTSSGRPNANRKLLYVSDNVEKMLGYTAGRTHSRAAGTCGWTAIHPERLPRKRRAGLPNAVRQRGEAFDVEYRIRRKDGQWIWLHNRAPSTQLREGTLCADGLLSGHHAAQAGRRGPAAGQGRRGSRQPRQEPVPRQHEPRVAHAAQRHHRLFRNPRRQDLWRPERPAVQIQPTTFSTAAATCSN